jgi:hypothetical protein
MINWSGFGITNYCRYCLWICCDVLRKATSVSVAIYDFLAEIRTRSVPNLSPDFHLYSDPFYCDYDDDIMKGSNSASVSNTVYRRRHFVHASVCTTSPSLYKRQGSRHVFFAATFPLVWLLTQRKLVRIHTGAYPHF